MIARWFL
jgi:hypothetical protein